MDCAITIRLGKTIALLSTISRGVLQDRLEEWCCLLDGPLVLHRSIFLALGSLSFCHRVEFWCRNLTEHLIDLETLLEFLLI